ncbi:MAG: endonuclease III [Eubacteriales bacterium]|nr:endonuclease III [Eubacteriales bacterium]
MPRLLSKKEVIEVLDLLKTVHPNPVCELVHDSPFELLVATILSAQCTDVRVNQITAKIFPQYNKPEDFADMEQARLEELIKSCGFFRNKAKNIIAASEQIVKDYGGEVPQTVEQLEQLAGVGRKTANVVASNAFGVPAIAVDTHVFRLANRIGMVQEKTVEKTEIALQKKIPKERWTEAHHLLIHHGRYICKARRPNCAACPIQAYCHYYKKLGQ